jgi:uncharacterized protein (TIGR02246 family)
MQTPEHPMKIEKHADTHNETSENARMIDALVDAYNVGDAAGFAALFAEGGWHGDLHTPTPMIGRDAIERRYRDVFAKYPENRTEVLHRIVFGPFVIDHERVRRSADAVPFDVVAIYTLQDGRIARAELVRE